MMRDADEYESEYMSDGGSVVHREKMSFPRWFRYFIVLAMMIALGLGVAGSVASGAWLPALFQAAMIPFMLFFMLMMSTLRCTVTNQQVTVQYGPWGPRIPLDNIEECVAEDYSLWKYGGYGIRYSLIEGAWCYNMLGDKGKAVRINYRSKSGKLKKLLIASTDNVALANAINQARAAVGETATNLSEEVVFEENFADDEVQLDAQEVASQQISSK